MRCFRVTSCFACALQDFKPKQNPLKYRLLDNSVSMAYKAKSNVEKALSQFMEIATTNVRIVRMAAEATHHPCTQELAH